MNVTPDPWLDKRGLADHLSCSVRSVETALAEGMPHAVIFGRIKFQVTDVEQWLEQHGYLTRRNGTLGPNDKRPGDASTPPGPDTGE